MTPTKTDLQKEKQYDADMQLAKDYVNQYFMEEELDRMGEMVLAEFAMKYLLHEAAAGRVKFTTNREGV